MKKRILEEKKPPETNGASSREQESIITGLISSDEITVINVSDSPKLNSNHENQS